MSDPFSLFALLAGFLGLGLLVAVLVAVAAGGGALALALSRGRSRSEQREPDVRPPAREPVDLTEGGLVQYHTYRGLSYKETIRVHCWKVLVPSGSLVVASAPGSKTGLVTGDPAFDHLFSIAGAPVDLALLTPVVRQSLISLALGRALRLRDGLLSMETHTFDPKDPARIGKLARLLQAEPTEPVERLRVSVTDPVAGVRYRALFGVLGLDPVLAAALARPLVRDDDPTVAAVASVILQDEGLERAVTSSAVDLEVRVWAAQTLAKTGTAEQRRRAGALLLAGASAHLHKSGLGLLKTAGPGIEPDLLAFLPRADGEILGMVVYLLAEVGTVAAVPLLRERQARLGALQAGLSHTIDQTIASLQKGLLQTRGGLALAGSASAQGALAVAGPQGALAVSPPASARRAESP